jgi:hypothetical protein
MDFSACWPQISVFRRRNMDTNCQVRVKISKILRHWEVPLLIHCTRLRHQFQHGGPVNVCYSSALLRFRCGYRPYIKLDVYESGQ